MVGVPAARGFVRALRRTSSRLLHPWFHARARRWIGRRRVPARVLFVCHGNVCRSPYAAAAFRHALPARLQQRIQIESAGFIGPDRPSPPEAVWVAGARGIHLATHSSRLLTRREVREASLVVVMEPRQRRALWGLFGRWRGVLVLGDLDPMDIDARAIQDPVTQPEEVFEACYDRIDRCVAELARAIAAVVEA